MEFLYPNQRRRIKNKVYLTFGLFLENRIRLYGHIEVVLNGQWEFSEPRMRVHAVGEEERQLANAFGLENNDVYLIDQEQKDFILSEFLKSGLLEKAKRKIQE